MGRIEAEHDHFPLPQRPPQDGKYACPRCGRASATPLLAQLHAARCSEQAAQREFAALIRRAAAKGTRT